MEQARGNLRDALAGLHNLAELLHSLRVGSKALAGALPGMYSACATIRGAVEEILSSVRARLPGDPALVELSEFFARRLEELENTIRYATDRPLNAKSRLALEQTMSRLSLELDTARGLLDLLAESISGRSVPLDLTELARQTAGPPSTGSWNRETIVAVLRPPAFGLELDVGARVATTLFGLGIELVAARSDHGVPYLCLGRDEDDSVSLRITQEIAPKGEELELAVRGLIEPTVSCLRAVARLIGAKFEWSATKVQFALTWPPAEGAKSSEAG